MAARFPWSGHVDPLLAAGGMHERMEVHQGAEVLTGREEGGHALDPALDRPGEAQGGSHDPALDRGPSPQETGREAADPVLESARAGVDLQLPLRKGLQLSGRHAVHHLRKLGLTLQPKTALLHETALHLLLETGAVFLQRDLQTDQLSKIELRDWLPV